MTVELFHDQSPLKYGTGPGSNSRPLDLQSESHLLPDTLPTALRGPCNARVGSVIYMPLGFKHGLSRPYYAILEGSMNLKTESNAHFL